MNDIKLNIVSPESTVVDTEVESVTLPGTLGSFQVLRDHAPLISSLEKGEIVYVKDGQKNSIPIASGFVEVLSNTVSVCVEM